jgi:hypothetical protein
MTKEEAIAFAALQDRLAIKEAECRQLRKELHDVRTHAQILQNKLAAAEITLDELRQPKYTSTGQEQESTPPES